MTLLPFPASAQNLKIFANFGTGFVVSRGGHVLTNMHVVDYCQRIVVQGALAPRLATVIGRDSRHDLALLKVDGTGFEPAGFRDEALPVVRGERVVVVGYPGKAAQLGLAITREAQIVDTKGPGGEDTYIQLSDEIERGNSGGPLMDAYGNVIGVIVAEAVIYAYDKSAPQDGSYKHSGVAIAAPVAKEFLKTYRVPYMSSDADSNLSADRLTAKAERFIVNVRCESVTEVR